MIYIITSLWRAIFNEDVSSNITSLWRAMILLIAGVVSISGGMSIFNLTREKEIKLTKEKLASILLSPEEKSVIDEIKKSNGEASQSVLVIKTGLSKVKIHRIITKLESKGVIKKYQYGLTNKVILQKEV